MATLTIHTSYISDDLDQLRAIGRTVDQLMGGDNEAGIRLHYFQEGVVSPPNGHSVYPVTVDRSKTTVGKQETEALLGKIVKKLRLLTEIKDIPDFTEGVRYIGEGRRWKIDYARLTANIVSHTHEDITGSVYSMVGETLANERILHEEGRI